MRKWRAILFDMDDTLYPERAYVSSGFRAVAAWTEPHSGVSAELGQAEMDALFDGGAKRDTFDRWLDARGMAGKEWVTQALGVYRAHVPQIVPYPEMVCLLEQLRGKYRLGIVSDGYLDVQQKKLAALGLADYFDVIVFSDEWGRENWKPSPVPFRVALERLGIAPEQAVYVGDNPRKDFGGARGAGLASIWLKMADGLYTDFVPTADQDADVTVKSFAELENIFQDDLSNYENINL